MSLMIMKQFERNILLIHKESVTSCCVLLFLLSSSTFVFVPSCALVTAKLHHSYYPSKQCQIHYKINNAQQSRQNYWVFNNISNLLILISPPLFLFFFTSYTSATYIRLLDKFVCLLFVFLFGTPLSYVWKEVKLIQILKNGKQNLQRKKRTTKK